MGDALTPCTIMFVFVAVVMAEPHVLGKGYAQLAASDSRTLRRKSIAGLLATLSRFLRLRWLCISPAFAWYREHLGSVCVSLERPGRCKGVPPCPCNCLYLLCQHGHSSGAPWKRAGCCIGRLGFSSTLPAFQLTRGLVLPCP
jgi:hypothetical protein